ncbi:MAG: DEAD/DEAH box helicase [Muribaculaceae bacterium]|nr:DEAD/DEAH box helicase [Muribaculaceae bacterium]
MRFEDILTNDSVLDGLYDMHFENCTPIQEAAIPVVMEGRDLLACAQTGTGKTAAYLLPVINELVEGGYPEDQVNCVIMAPTRELAQQIDRQLQGFSYFMPVSGCAIYGGTDGYAYEQQRKSLKAGADIIIATPGRLISHLSMGYVDLSKVSFFILDEADRMLDMGFSDDILQIISHLPKERQTLLFSATMPPKIQQLANKILRDPVEIKLAVSKPADKIEQRAYICHESQKLPLLKSLFKENAPSRAIIFSSSKIKVKQLARELRGNSYKVAEMHSDLDQIKRDDVILDFKAGKINVIVATDILSRGIDIDDIEIVINYDVPHDPEDYIHRIGRTARADREGRAATFVSEIDFGKLRQIERLLEKEVPKAEVPSEMGETPIYNKEAPARRKSWRSRNGKKSQYSHKHSNNRNRRPASKRNKGDNGAR